MSGFYLGDQRYADHGEPCTSTSTQKRQLVDVIRDQWDECWKPHTKEGISLSTDTGFYVNKTGITQCPHCQSSFWQPLRISFQSRFLRFDNISHVMISFSNPAWRHFTMTRMRTCLILETITIRFGVFRTMPMNMLMQNSQKLHFTGPQLKATLPSEDVCIFLWGGYCNANFGMVESLEISHVESEAAWNKNPRRAENFHSILASLVI